MTNIPQSGRNTQHSDSQPDEPPESNTATRSGDIFDLADAPEILAPVASIYHHRLARYGASPKGVYWRHQFGQFLRFELLLGLVPKDRWCEPGLVLNDLGCGYGAFFDFVKDRVISPDGLYIGYDICEKMVQTASHRIRDPRARFVQSAVAQFVADYSFVSGTFNMKLDVADKTWNGYVKESLRHLWMCSRSGLGFNMLDVAGREDDGGLYFAESDDFVDFCRRELSRNVTLVDNAPLKEWTILICRGS